MSKSWASQKVAPLSFVPGMSHEECGTTVRGEGYKKETVYTSVWLLASAQYTSKLIL